MPRGKHSKKRLSPWWPCLFLLVALIAVSITALATRQQARTSQKTATTRTATAGTDDRNTAILAKKMVTIGFTGTILIIKNGRTHLALSRGFANKPAQLANGTRTAFEIDSVQKSLTAALIMQEVQGGHLQLRTPLSTFYPQIPGSRQITIRQMLDMTSGLSCKSFTLPKYTDDQQVVSEYIRHLNYTAKNANTWQYQPVNYNLLAGILHKLTGQTYQTLVTRRLIKPLHLTGTHFAYVPRKNDAVGYGWTEDATDYTAPYNTTDAAKHFELGTGQLFMTARDLYRVERVIVSGKLLGRSASTELHRSGSSSSYGGGLYQTASTYFANGYGYGFSAFLRIGKNGKDAVIMLCNTQPGDYRFKSLADALAKDNLAG